MSLIIIIGVGAGGLLLGVLIGYYLRKIIALGKRRSIEIDIKQMMVAAKEEAQRITEAAKKESEEKLGVLKEEEKKKEQEFKEKETRLIKKDEFLDARQVEIDKEVENIKLKVEEIKTIREKVVKIEEELDRRAKDILATTIQRLASSTASELMTTVVSIPNNEIKGKIIGKEG